jgi:hypothetical protein
MQKICLLLLVLLVVPMVMAEVRINEVMAKTPTSLYGDNCEWIELYSDSPINLTNFTINTNPQETEFSFYLEDFVIITKDKDSFLENWTVDESKVIEWSSIGMADSGDNISIFNETELISNFEYSSSKDNESWSFESSEWKQCTPTPGEVNDCPEENQNNNNDDDQSIILDLDWDDDEIINGKDFRITVTAENLDSGKSYDIKLWIENDDEDTISETYDDGEWDSSEYYLTKVFENEQEDSINIKLRIDEDYNEFKGDARIWARIREHGDNDYIEEENARIKILEKNESESEDEEEDDEETGNKGSETATTNSNDKPESDEPIVLGSFDDNKEENKKNNTETEDIKTQNNILYQSKQELIKKYAIYGFTLLCIILCVLLAWNKLE